MQQGSRDDGEFYGHLQIRDILKENKIDDNLELHCKLITSFWLAAVAFGECLPEICYYSFNRINFLTFLISDVNIWHHRGLTLFWWKDPFLWINSHVPSCSSHMRIWNYITNESLHFG